MYDQLKKFYVLPNFGNFMYYQFFLYYHFLKIICITNFFLNLSMTNFLKFFCITNLRKYSVLGTNFFF